MPAVRNPPGRDLGVAQRRIFSKTTESSSDGVA